MKTHYIVDFAVIALLTLAKLGDSRDVKDQTSTLGSAVWLDEGVMAKGELHEWEEQKTFCFYNNATLRVRLDPLDR